MPAVGRCALADANAPHVVSAFYWKVIVTLLAKLLPYIKSQEPIPAPLTVEAFNTATDTLKASKRRAIAAELLEGAGEYLSSWHLSRLVSAEISDDEALEAIAERRIFMQRAACLMPALLSLFQVRTDSTLKSVLHRIDDCCSDFPTIQSSAHEKKTRKEILKGIGKLKEQVSALNATLESVGHHINIDFAHHMRAVLEFRKEANPAGGYYERFREELDCLSLSADLVLYKESRGERGFFVIDNKAKTHIVECVYSISIWLGSPPFVTTPGSDFSVACSLLYELAGGESDVSLAGAINKFARSDLRKRMDEDEKESRWENSDEGMQAYEADNFAATKGRIATLDAEQAFWKEMIAAKDWNEFERTQLILRLLYVRDQLERASLEHGPYLVWASQFSEGDRMERWRQMQEMEVRTLKSEIELGRMRREGRRD